MTIPLADVHPADPVLVCSHLRWGEHLQRPQQLLARLARYREILFVEPPRFLDDIARPQIEHAVPYPGVHRLMAKLPVSYRIHERVAHITVRTLVMEMLGPHGAFAHRVEAPILWFSTPLPAPFMIGVCGERLVVYDPMPRAAVPRHQRALFDEREALLLRHANLVFADREADAAPGRHRTADAWDTLAVEIDQLLRDVSANRTPTPTTLPVELVPGWLAARISSPRRP